MRVCRVCVFDCQYAVCLIVLVLGLGGEGVCGLGVGSGFGRERAWVCGVGGCSSSVLARKHA